MTRKNPPDATKKEVAELRKELRALAKRVAKLEKKK